MKKFKVVVVGCGEMSNTWIKYAMERNDCQIVAMVDIKKENAEEKINQYKLNCKAYLDLEEAIKDSGANLVMDISIPEAHNQISIIAFNNGCNVLGEKPMADTFDNAKIMVVSARENNKVYSVMQNRRYNKNIRDFREIIRAGKIGEPGFICVDFFLGPHFGGFRDIMKSPLILDMAIHTFDQGRFLIGSDPISVYCKEFNPKGSWYKGNASAVCIFEFANGEVMCYRGSWCAEGANTSWEGIWRVVGSKGTAVWDGVNRPYYESPEVTQDFIRVSEKVEADFTYEGRDGHYGCLDEMFNALIENRQSETHCEDNIKSMAMVFGALESAEKCEKVLL